ncbi:MAG: metallopeptidase family protein [Ignavibacteriales bacterium]|nr:metallopeptidase family protein [Ignavibacteriales bacterium]
MTKERFEEIAQSAFDSLPEEFKSRIENVHIVVEDEPSDDVLENVRGGRSSLLGLYQGTPLPHRNTWYGTAPTGPDKITLYRKNIESVCRNEAEVELRILEVLYHEIGHYFGMNEREIRAAMKHFQ